MTDAHFAMLKQLYREKATLLRKEAAAMLYARSQKLYTPSQIRRAMIKRKWTRKKIVRFWRQQDELARLAWRVMIQSGVFRREHASFQMRSISRTGLVTLHQYATHCVLVVR